MKAESRNFSNIVHLIALMDHRANKKQAIMNQTKPAPAGLTIHNLLANSQKQSMFTL